MKKYKFLLQFTEPEVWYYTIIIEASSTKDAYFRAFYEFADHITRWNLAPEELTISCEELVEKEKK